MNNIWPEAVELDISDLAWVGKTLGDERQEYVISHPWQPISTLPKEEGHFVLARKNPRFQLWEYSDCKVIKGEDDLLFLTAQGASRTHDSVINYTAWTHWRQRCINPPEVNHER